MAKSYALSANFSLREILTFINELDPESNLVERFTQRLSSSSSLIDFVLPTIDEYVSSLEYAVAESSDPVKGFVTLWASKVSRKQKLQKATPVKTDESTSRRKQPASKDVVSPSKTLLKKVARALPKTVKRYCSTDNCSVCTSILEKCPITPCKHASPHQHGYFPHLPKKLAKRIHDTNDFTVLLSINGTENPLKTGIAKGPHLGNVGNASANELSRQCVDVAVQKTPPHVMECDMQTDPQEEHPRGSVLDDVLAYAPMDLVKDIHYAMHKAGRLEAEAVFGKVVTNFGNCGKRFSTPGPSSSLEKRRKM